jgi:hypothetical protein
LKNQYGFSLASLPFKILIINSNLVITTQAAFNFSTSRNRPELLTSLTYSNIDSTKHSESSSTNQIAIASSSNAFSSSIFIDSTKHSESSSTNPIAIASSSNAFSSTIFIDSSKPSESSSIKPTFEKKSKTGVIIGSVLGSVGGFILLGTFGYFVWKYQLLNFLKSKKIKPSNEIPLETRV